MLRVTLGIIGLVIGVGAIGFIALSVLMLPLNSGGVESGRLYFLILGLVPIGGFIGWWLGAIAGQFLRYKAGNHEGPLAAFVVILVLLGLVGWVLMELFGGW